MPLLHKFQEHDFGDGFMTHNSILDTVPYDPEVIFIGTFNHGWSWNHSDFFYGRDMFMWTALGNLFLHKKNHLTKKRTKKNNEPTPSQLKEICVKGKIVFADIVKGIKNEIPTVEIKSEKCVLVNNQYRWEKWKTKNVGKYSDTHLENLAKKNWLDDNVPEIIKYINETPSIKHVYFTFKSGKWLSDKLREIEQGIENQVSICSIFTPTVSGFGENLEIPFKKRAWSLTHCWVWNGKNHKVKINKPGYGHLDHEWLISKGVNPKNF